MVPVDDNLVAHTRRQLRDLHDQQQRLVDAYRAGTISLTDLQERRRPLSERASELEELVADLDRSALHGDLKQRVGAFSQVITEGLATVTFSQRQQLVRTVLDKVVVYGDRVELCFKVRSLPAQRSAKDLG